MTTKHITFLETTARNLRADGQFDAANIMEEAANALRVGFVDRSGLPAFSGLKQQ